MKKMYGYTLLSVAVLTAAACSGRAHRSQTSSDADFIETVAIGARTDIRNDLPVPYEQFIGSARFAPSASYDQNGYHVESGNLTENGRVSGMLVTVRCPDGAILAVVNDPDFASKSGTWHVTSQGQSSFMPMLPADFRRPDQVAGTQFVPDLSAKSAEDGTTIDLLVGYSRAAANRMGDPIAYALLQAESVNLAMRNSSLEYVVLRVSGVQIVDENIKITPATLQRVSTTFRAYYGFNPDVTVGFADAPGSEVPGLTNLPNEAHHMLTGVDWPTSLRHQMGHIAGGGHCNDGGEASKDDYKFGFFNGKNGTVMCGNDTPYYSNPALVDEYGLPRGDTKTADMARLWAQRAWWIANRHPAANADHLMLASVNGDTSATLTMPTLADAYTGFVINTSSSGMEGPQALADDHQAYARVVALMSDKFAKPQSVVFRAQRITQCSQRSMQYFYQCWPGRPSVDLKISFFEVDNPRLVSGMLSGALFLQAKDYYAADWHRDIHVLVSINRLPKTVLSLDNTASAGPVTNVAQVNGGRYLAMIATDSSEGPVQLVASAERDFTFLTPTLIDDKGVKHPVRLRAQRILTRCKSRAINIRDTCQVADLELGVSYLPEDNVDLPAGVHEGAVQLSAINYTDSERIPVTLNIKIKK